MAWLALWQRLLLVALVLLNAWEADVLFQQRPFLATLSGAMAFFLLVILARTWPRKQRNRRHHVDSISF